MEQVTFIKASPLREVREAADADIVHRATTQQVQLLYENPLLWLRALLQIRRQIQNHIAKDRRQLGARKPSPGEIATAEYLAAKAGMDERTARRLHVIELVNGRLEDVKVILGPTPPDPMIVGDVIEAFTDIAQLADGGELESAADKAWHWAKRLSSREG